MLTKISTLLLRLFFITLVTSILSCGTLQVPVTINDEDLYYLKGSSGAVEMHFLTSGQTDLTLDQWNAIEEGMVAMPLSAFSDFNKEIGELCSQVTCSYEVTQKFSALVARLRDASQSGSTPPTDRAP